MEIRRFGPGHRRREGLAGARGVSGQGIHNDARGNIAELAFARQASIPPHSNPNTTWFVVIEGGGFVQVGDERARVAAGEAVLWPANVIHAAWTEHSTMRAVVVEFAGEGDVPLLIEARAVEPAAGLASASPTAESRGLGEAAAPAALPGLGASAALPGSAPPVEAPSSIEAPPSIEAPAGPAAQPDPSALRADGALARKPPVTQERHHSPDEEPW